MPFPQFWESLFSKEQLLKFFFNYCIPYSLDERTVNELMFAFAQAQHKGDLQDKEFEANPDKKASLCKMREGEDLHSGKLYYFMTQPPFGAKINKR